MAKFTYNERFTNVNKYDDFSNSYTGIKIASKLNQKNGEDYKLVDVTDLDWQGAWLRAAGSYINDTYELLEAIDNIADLAELEWVKNKINEHDVHITNIVNVLPSYITRNEFESIISQQQRALIPGSYIRIDSENVISTYDLLSISDAEDIYTTKEELNDFFQSKFEYFRVVSGYSAMLIGLLEITYFVSDCQLFGRFATETLIPRLAILLPMLIFWLLYPSVKDYKVGIHLYYMMPHAAMWCTIWAIWYLPNRDFAREGFIIMHFAFLAIGLAMPLKYHIPIHACLLLNIIISNT